MQLLLIDRTPALHVEQKFFLCAKKENHFQLFHDHGAEGVELVRNQKKWNNFFQGKECPICQYPLAPQSRPSNLFVRTDAPIIIKVSPQRQSRKDRRLPVDVVEAFQEESLDLIVDPSAPGGISFRQDMESQIVTLAVHLRRAGMAIVSALDEKGFISRALENLITPELPREPLEQALEQIQNTFDPPGVATPDVRKCWMLQLARKARIDSLEYQILTDHRCAEYLERLHLNAICNRLERTRTDVDQAVGKLKHLLPYPSWGYDDVDEGAGNADPTEDDVVEPKDEAAIDSNEDSFEET